MLGIDDESILTDFERAEQQTPTSKKILDSTSSIYTSQKLCLSKDMLWGQPVLCDLGQSRIRTHNQHCTSEIPEGSCNVLYSLLMDPFFPMKLM